LKPQSKNIVPHEETDIGVWLRYAFLLTTFLCAALGLSAHPDSEFQETVDSLRERLGAKPSDSLRVILLVGLANAFHYVNTDSSIIFGRQALELSFRLHSDQGKAMAYNSLGFAYLHQAKYEKALESMFNALPIYEGLNDKYRVAFTLNYIGNVYAEYMQNDKAIDFFSKALTVFAELDNQQYIAVTTGNIGIMYQKKAVNYEAFTYLNRAIRIHEQRHDYESAAIIKIYLGLVHNQEREYAKALTLFEECLPAIRLPKFTAICHYNMGFSYGKLNNYGKAVWHTHEALRLLSEGGFKKEMKQCYRIMAFIHQEMGDYVASLRYFQAYANLSDSLRNDELSYRIADMQTKYEFESKEIENQVLRQEQKDKNTFLSILIIFLLLTFSFLIVMVIQRRRQLAVNQLLRQKNEEIHRQKEDFKLVADDLKRLHQEVELKNGVLEQKNDEAKVQKETIEKAFEDLEKTHQNLKNAQVQLIQAEKMAALGILTAGMAHEINNPLNFIYAGTESLKANLDDLLQLIELYSLLDSAQTQDWESIKEKIKQRKQQIDFERIPSDSSETIQDVLAGAERIAEIVKSLKVFTRIQDEERKPVHIQGCMEAILRILKPQYDKRIEIVKNYEEKLPACFCFVAQINQALMNIMINAVQSIEKSGYIYISTAKVTTPVLKKGEKMIEPPYMQLIIRDSGCGMSEEVKAKIFEPFFTTRKVGQGKGLGLSVAFSVIEQHGGTIQIFSEAGKGTDVVITLPFEIPNT
jgi:two-component system, NtrC family, sensor kinase